MDSGWDFSAVNLTADFDAEMLSSQKKTMPYVSHSLSGT